MRFLLVVFFITFTNVNGQNFPNPATLSTGQGVPGTYDVTWEVNTQWLAVEPTNTLLLNYTDAYINNNCAPGFWVEPSLLPPPVNNGNWITSDDATCGNNTSGYRVFRLPLDLPSDCNGNPISSINNYILYFSGYVDNVINNIYVNGTPKNISGGSFFTGDQLNFQLNGPWISGINYIDIVVQNYPSGGVNPFGLLMVADSNQTSISDIDNDGIPDLYDLCPCQPGALPDGCCSVPNIITVFTQVPNICSGATLNALPTTSNNGVSGTWTPALNNTATTTYTFTPDAGQCATTETMTITVNPNITPTFTQVPTICSGTTLNALPTTSSNGITGTWSPALNNTSTTTYTFSPNTGQCASTATMTIVVDPQSVLYITNNDVNCNPSQLSWSTVNTINSSTAIASIGSNSITINNTSGGLFSTSNVYNGGVFPSQYNLPINNLTLANNISGLFTFCFNTPVSNPQIAIASIGNPGLPVPINTSVPYQVIWEGPGMSFINNQSLVGQEGYCIIVFPGTHQCISFDYLTSEHYCNIVFGTQDNNCQIEPICMGESVVLVPHGSTNITWSPTNDLTFLPNSNNVIATPSQTTTYTITSNNSCQNQASITITVNPNITPTFTPIADICSGAILSALPTSSINGFTGTWSPALNNTATTTYTFTPDAGQCATTETMTITVNPNITPTFNQVAPICSGATLNALPTSSNNGITGTWSPLLDNTVTTTYTFTPDAGQCATNETMTITVNPNITPTFNQVASICSGATLNALPTTSNNGITGTWSPALDSTTTTTYTFTPDAGQCATNETMTITVNPLPLTPTGNSNQNFCAIDNPTVSDLVVSGSNILWYQSASGGSPLSLNFDLIDGMILYASSIDVVTNCENPTRFPVTIQVENPVLPSISSEQVFCLETNLTLGDIDTNGTVINWYDNAVGGNLVPLTQLLNNGDVYYGASVSPVSGCESTARIPLEITIIDSNLSFFNLITIDDNDLNKELIIQGIEQFPNNAIEIYNRYGNLVWSGINYDNVSNTFKGMASVSGVVSQGSYLPTGTYFFILSYPNDCEKSELKGFIQIDNKR
jgi:hypothetical protein